MKRFSILRSSLLLAAALAGAVVTFAASANEARIRQVLTSRFPGMRIDGVQAAPMPGLFEVRLQTPDGPQILYTDAQASHLIAGNLVEIKSGRNLTEDRLQRLTAISFSSLPLDQAVKIQRGNGKRVLAMFTDPYCPYCRRFEQALLQMDDLTVYIFMYPVIRPQNADHSRAVWCSPDRAKAWLDLAAAETPKPPAASPNCDNPVDRVLELGRSLRINGTPTLFFANGDRVSGGMQLADLRAKLDEVSRAPATRKN